MGSFNTTCFASQQTIVPGAKCIIIPILQQSTYNPVSIEKGNEQTSAWGIADTTCYPSCFWGHEGPIIYGEYYDYGCFVLENSNDNISAIIALFNHLHDKAYTTHSGKNTCHEVAFNIKELYNPKASYTFFQLVNIWEQVWNTTQEQRLFVQDYLGLPRPFQFAVMHEKTAQYLINKVEAYTTYDNLSYEQKSYFKHYVQSHLSRIKTYFGNDSKKDKNTVLDFFQMRLPSLDNYRIGQQEGTYFSNFYDYYDKIESILKTYDGHDSDIADLSDEIINRLFEMFKREIDHRYIHMGLDALNIKLTPMVYAGQDYDNETGSDYLAMIQAVNASINQEIKDKYDD